tara:strand:+ start:922 stop:1140 length:219 start_codon:yes stop_codon:yes gene_type:complete
MSGKKNLNPFLPKTIGIEVNKPSQAFLEKVKNAAKPVDMRKLKAAVFLNKLFPLWINKAMQNGQTKFSQDAA